MHRSEIFYALICINNHVLSYLISMLSLPRVRSFRYKVFLSSSICQLLFISLLSLLSPPSILQLILNFLKLYFLHFLIAPFQLGIFASPPPLFFFLSLLQAQFLFLDVIRFLLLPMSFFLSFPPSLSFLSLIQTLIFLYFA